MATNLMGREMERLDKIYVCKVCQESFLFKADIEDHMMHMPVHQDFVSVPFK